MCPSYRVTREERDVTRGRANSLRLAITGQLGPDALTSDEMAETMKLCVSCKGCRRECPTGVDMARMKIEVQAARAEKYGLSLHDRLVGYLPRYAPYAAQGAVAAESARHAAGRGDIVGGARGLQRAAQRCRNGARMFSTTPSRRRHRTRQAAREVVLFADTFNRYFERENLDAALGGAERRRLSRAYRRSPPTARRARCAAAARSSPSARSTRRAREAERTLAALEPFVARGVPVIGLEPSCLLSFRDEVPAMVKGEARAAARRARADLRGIPGARGEGRPAQSAAEEDRRPRAAARPLPSEGVRRASARSRRVLKLMPDLKVETDRIELLRHGRRFGYAADTIDVSLAMGELSLLPAVRKADAGHADRRRRHLLPPSDPRRRGPRGACMSRACWR